MTDHHSHLRRLVESRSDDMHLDPMTHFKTLSGIAPTLPSLEEAESWLQKEVDTKAEWVQRQVVMKTGYLPKDIHDAFGGEAAFKGAIKKWMAISRTNANMIKGVKDAIEQKARDERQALKARNARRRALGDGVSHDNADDLDEADKLGKPDVVSGMKFGTRYKYNHGIFIDHVEDKGEFHVSQAGRPSKKLGFAKSLEKAKEIALRKGDFMESTDDLAEGKFVVKADMMRVGGPHNFGAGWARTFGDRNQGVVVSAADEKAAVEKFAKAKGLNASYLKAEKATPESEKKAKTEAMDDLFEELSLSKQDKKVIAAFLDKRAASSKKLTTGGQTLDIMGMGGRGCCQWKAGKIAFQDLGSRSGQVVQRAVRKAAPKNWLAEDVDDLAEGAEEFRAQAIRLEPDPKAFRELAKKHHVEIVLETHQAWNKKGGGIQFHVKLPDGKYKLYSPGGPGRGSYLETASAATNYGPKGLMVGWSPEAQAKWGKKESMDEVFGVPGPYGPGGGDKGRYPSPKRGDSGRYELVYGTGGTGGPYQGLDKAKAAAERLLKGNRNETWIAVIPAAQTTDLAAAKPVEYLHRKHGWNKGGGMTMKQIFRGYFEGVDPGIHEGHPAGLPPEAYNILRVWGSSQAIDNVSKRGAAFSYEGSVESDASSRREFAAEVKQVAGRLKRAGYEVMKASAGEKMVSGTAMPTVTLHFQKVGDARNEAAGAYFVLVDVSKPGGRLVSKKLFQGLPGLKKADAIVAKLREKGRDVQVIDAAWYAPADELVAAVKKEEGVEAGDLAEGAMLKPKKFSEIRKNTIFWAYPGSTADARHVDSYTKLDAAKYISNDPFVTQSGVVKDRNMVVYIEGVGADTETAIADGSVLVTESIQRYRVLAGMDPLPSRR